MFNYNNFVTFYSDQKVSRITNFRVTFHASIVQTRFKLNQIEKQIDNYLTNYQSRVRGEEKIHTQTLIIEKRNGKEGTYLSFIDI